MPTIILIRHGENEYTKTGRLAGRLPGVHLNEKGQQQAAKLAQVLATAPVKAIYSSPLERTLETAAPIAAALSLEITQRAGLIELDMGEWQGKTLKALRHLKAWRVVQQRPSLFRFPGGESFVEAQLRFVREIEALCALHDPKDLIICVSHSDMIKLAAAYYQGLPLDLFQRLMISTASMTTMHVGEEGAFLVNLNVPAVVEFSRPPEKKGEEKPPTSE